MSNLTIRKKSLKTWLHTDSVFGDFIISKFYFNSFEAKFQIVEEGNSRLEKYEIANITLYDDTDGGVAETFSTITELSLRLEQLNYPAFQQNGQIISIAGLIEAGTNVTITGEGTEASPYVINSTGGGTSQQITSKVVYCTLADVGATSPFQEDIDALVKDWVVAQGITKADNEDYTFVLVDELPSEYNFDIEATDWANSGITDEASFIAYLENQGATDVVVTNFSLIDGRLQCNLSFGGTTELSLNDLGITKINNTNSLVNLTLLYLGYNSISTIENIENLVNLTYLYLNNNNISTIENIENLVNLTILYLNTDNFTDYSLSEAWATSQPAFTNPCVIFFTGNPNSPIGTTFETIMNTKNATLIY